MEVFQYAYHRALRAPKCQRFTNCIAIAHQLCQSTPIVLLPIDVGASPIRDTDIMPPASSACCLNKSYFLRDCFRAVFRLNFPYYNPGLFDEYILPAAIQ